MTEGLGTCFLYTWFSSARGDHFTTSDPAWTGRIGDIRNSGDDYELMRIEGRVFSPNFPKPPGTVPLWNFWNRERGDNFLTTQPHWVQSQSREGYTRFRLEGYIYIETGEDRLPLKSFWNPRTLDNLATSADPDELYSFNRNWGEYRTEGFLLPEIQRITSLYTWYSRDRQDHFTTTNPDWEGIVGDRRVSGVEYELMRIEGRVFSPDVPQPKGTRALWSFWNRERGDNFLTTQPHWVRSRGREGYTRFRLEGFIYASGGPGRARLASYWNPRAEDNAATTARPGGLRSLTSDWGEYREEGFLFPNGQLVRPTDITEPLIPTAVLRGDREFDGSPDITARLKLVISPDGRQVVAKIYFLAFEPKPDWSTTEATWERVVYTAPRGRRIVALASPVTSEVRFIGPSAGGQFLFPGEDFKDVASIIKGVSGIIAAALKVVDPTAGDIAKGIDSALSVFMTGLAMVKFEGNKVSTVVPIDGPVLFFAIVGDTGGDDISTDLDPKDDTRIVAIRMLEFEVVMT